MSPTPNNSSASSIPSPKAEPFKLWLAKVGFERLEEIENPELAAKRMRQLYEQKGIRKNGSRNGCAASLSAMS